MNEYQTPPANEDGRPTGLSVSTGSEWLDRPNCNGWWIWRERGSSHRDERLLIAGNGAIVASDDEWEQETGRPAEDGAFSYNYWEGTDTTQEMMPGRWRLAPQNAELSNAGPSASESKDGASPGVAL
jgi:hypothetical protein